MKHIGLSVAAGIVMVIILSMSIAASQGENRIEISTYNDLNSNGVHELEDIPLQNVIVILSLNGSPYLTKTSNISGLVEFTDLPNGNYALTISRNNLNSGNALEKYVISDLGPDNIFTSIGSTESVVLGSKASAGFTKKDRFILRLMNEQGDLYSHIPVSITAYVPSPPHLFYEYDGIHHLIPAGRPITQESRNGYASVGINLTSGQDKFYLANIPIIPENRFVRASCEVKTNGTNWIPYEKIAVEEGCYFSDEDKLGNVPDGHIGTYVTAEYITRVTLVYAGLLPTEPTPTPNSTDFSVIEVKPIQVVEDQEILIQNKATSLKAVIHVNGHEHEVSTDVQLKVGDDELSEFYVYNPNSSSPLTTAQRTLTFSANDNTETIYFFGDELKPNASKFQATVTVDPNDQTSEANENNNTLRSHVLNVINGRSEEIVFYPLDWEDWPNDQTEYESFGNAAVEYIQAVYPIADGDENFIIKDRNQSTFNLIKNAPLISTPIDIPEIDFPFVEDRVVTLHDKESALFYFLNLWTLGDKFNLFSNAKYVLVTPTSWFKDHFDNPNQLGAHSGFTGVSIVRVTTEHQGPLVTHELGHAFGLFRGCEDYDENCDDVRDRIGSLADRGMWVTRKQPMLGDNIYSYMGIINSDHEYWSTKDNFDYIAGKSGLNNQLRSSEHQSILAIGYYDQNTLELADWYHLSNAYEVRDSNPISSGLRFEYLNSSSTVIHNEYRSTDEPYNSRSSSALFSEVIPFMSDAATIRVHVGNKYTAQKFISSTAPKIDSFLVTNRNNDSVDISWSSTDADQDSMSYSLFWSDDSDTWIALALGITQNTYQWNVTDLSEGTYMVKLIVSDGLRTNESDIRSFEIMPTSQLMQVFLPKIN
ncbi:MAG: hypothetical protein AAF702_01530 [Chloroflexota bacterium]